jgi:hypothetical protein
MIVDNGWIKRIKRHVRDAGYYRRASSFGRNIDMVLSAR